MRAYDDILRIRVSLPFVHETIINTYLIQGDPPLLVESGPGYGLTTKELLPKLTQKGIAGTLWVVNTHEHPDHFGGNVELRRAMPGVKFACHPVAYENFDRITYSPPKEAIPYIGEERCRLLQAYEGQFKEAKAQGVERFLREGEEITAGRYTFQVLHLPGHAPGHICLYEPSRKILFSGDNVIGRGTPYVGARLDENDRLEANVAPQGDMGTYLKSLERLQSLDIETIFPAHGPVSNKERISQTYQKKLAKLEKVCQLLAAEGPLSLREATERLYAGFGAGARLLQGATAAYIKKLLEEGRVRRIEGDLVRYGPP